ncbi:GMC oxidoreductase [Microbacterium sp. ASV49]|uniref:GMC family oxidoreductase n=1 Tax=Microbacterium candidum TaxID=3041922 RepID=A0ABT7MTX6_9MICO|nr:GMC family oxidoreductase [Microbacterium sp. ASV49]MDL9977907.1 GMC family oxidoreductase [Microbacterium sp. ASV49]
MAITADVVVIGSGMGGGVTALALARRGIDVLLVERGERIRREPQNWSPEAVFRDRRYKPDETWLDERGHAYRPGVHYVVGGSTKVYGASLPRFRESDFTATEHANGLSPAWPFTYADLEPYYAQAEELFRVHGTTGQDPTEPWRSSPYPFPALEHEPYIADLADRLRGQGVSPAANAMGVDLRPGGLCIRCGTCDGFPCLLGAKSDAETCAVDPGLATGNLRLLTGVRIDRLETDAAGRTVVAAVGSGPDGEVRISASRFVVSAGAVNSAALLLRSADEKNPNGLANASGRVGRNYMMHNNAHIAAFDVRRRSDVIFQKTLSVNDWYHDEDAAGVMQLVGKVRGSMMKLEVPLAPTAALEQFSRRSVEWLVMAEDLPSPDNRVLVDASGRIVTHRRALGVTTHRRLMRNAKRLLHSVGYQIIGTQWFGIEMNSHMCGTTVAGDDPATSVVDGWCRAHDIPNLWIVDAGFFPSSAAMNPALTIAAQALRVVAESDLAA